ncbi:M16 family metallopeptidase [Granulicella arctica]|uniref:Putative Zn-dependent peptidase n=1 Tax=Granulicella arctica TaxID=940613 RepID=A0A7Y9PJE5_9BACT|nr:pitrilysin family protein [Granulicella arctica]NYF80850.1 putative Zn-dependent peptidase [Granulicella arctica]
MTATLTQPIPTPSIPRNIRKTILPNGLLVLTESMPHLRSISMGVWINSGSRDESPEINGISHFVEHMVFKGTTTRSAQQLAREVDTIGGNLDAFTGKETICFNIKVLDENVEPALDLLTDLVLHPTFTPDELAREQGVILEEIKMDEDNPDYLVHEIHTQNYWKGDALGRPILGTVKTVSSFNQQIVFDYYASRFTPSNMVFSAAGNLDHDTFVEQVAHHFRSLSASTNAPIVRQAPPTAYPHITLKNKKSLEQVQFCLSVPAPPVHAENRYIVFLLNTMLGGGMSSRLFQTIREDQGLAYTIYSEMNPFRDTGALGIYAGASAEKTPQVLRLTLQELRRFKEELVPDSELKRARDQLKSNMVIGLETSSSRMSNLARQQMYFGRFFSIDEAVSQIEQVTPAQIQALAHELFQPDLIALTLLGNLGSMKIDRNDLAC